MDSEDVPRNTINKERNKSIITTPCLVHLEVGQVRLNPPLLITIIAILCKKINKEKNLARVAGFEPATYRLTAYRSTN